MITIDQEARQQANQPFDLDNFCERYRTANGLFTFSSPSLWTLDKHFFFLLKNSREEPFNMKYSMRPDYLSFDEYGTVILAPVLMYVNGVFCYEDFILDTVIIPSFSAIMETLQDRFPPKSFTELEGVVW